MGTKTADWQGAKQCQPEDRWSVWPGPSLPLAELLTGPSDALQPYSKVVSQGATGLLMFAGNRVACKAVEVESMTVASELVLQIDSQLHEGVGCCQGTCHQSPSLALARRREVQASLELLDGSSTSAESTMSSCSPSQGIWQEEDPWRS